MVSRKQKIPSRRSLELPPFGALIVIYILFNGMSLTASSSDLSKEKALAFDQYLNTFKHQVKREIKCVLYAFSIISDNEFNVPLLNNWSCTYPTIFGFNIIHTPDYVLYDDLKIPAEIETTFTRQGTFYYRPPLTIEVNLTEEEFYQRLKRAGILKPQEDKTTLPKTLRRRIPMENRE